MSRAPLLTNGRVKECSAWTAGCAICNGCAVAIIRSTEHVRSGELLVFQKCHDLRAFLRIDWRLWQWVSTPRVLTARLLLGPYQNTFLSGFTKNWCLAFIPELWKAIAKNLSCLKLSAIVYLMLLGKEVGQLASNRLRTYWAYRYTIITEVPCWSRAWVTSRYLPSQSIFFAPKDGFLQCSQELEKCNDSRYLSSSYIVAGSRKVQFPVPFLDKHTPFSDVQSETFCHGGCQRHLYNVISIHGISPLA